MRGPTADYCTILSQRVGVHTHIRNTNTHTYAHARIYKYIYISNVNHCRVSTLVVCSALSNFFFFPFFIHHVHNIIVIIFITVYTRRWLYRTYERKSSSRKDLYCLHSCVCVVCNTRNRNDDRYVESQRIVAQEAYIRYTYLHRVHQENHWRFSHINPQRAELSPSSSRP